MNEKQNDPRWLIVKHDCGEQVSIDSEEHPVFFSEPDDENKIAMLVAICPKCSNTITITRDDIGNTVTPLPKLKWEWRWE